MVKFERNTSRVQNPKCPQYTFQIFEMEENQCRGSLHPITHRKTFDIEFVVYGVTEIGESICVRLLNYKPHIYIAVKEIKNESHGHQLKALLNPSRDSGEVKLAESAYLMKKAELRDAMSTPDHMLRVNFMSQTNRYQFVRRLREIHDPDTHEFFDMHVVHNADIKALQQFVTDTKIRPCYWYNVPYMSVIENSQYRMSKCDIECAVDIKDVVSRDDITTVAPFLLMSVDIEVNGRDNIFPTYTVDPVSCINYTIMHWDHPSTKSNVCITYPGANTKTLPASASSSCGDYDIICCASEEECLIKFTEAMNGYGVDILTGYNTVNFDIPYLINRSAYLSQKYTHSNPTLSQLLMRATCMSKVRNQYCKVKESKFQSAQKGTRKDYKADLRGIIQFDLFPIVKSIYKFNSYKLDAVAFNILGDKKEDVPHYLITRLFNRNAECQLKVMSYCAKDAEICVRLLLKELLIIRYIEDSRTTYTNINALIFSGQQEKALMQMLPELEQNDLVFKWKETFFYDTISLDKKGRIVYTKVERDDNLKTDKYEGATVVDPKKGFYPDLTGVCLDLNSLYPSIMIRYNICFLTFLATLEGTPYTKEDVYESPIGVYFLKPHIRKGMLPNVLERLLAQRKATKRKMVTFEEGSPEYNVQNMKQLCEKISCNSIYGITGASSGVLFCRDIAASVTSYGRYIIKTSAQEAAKCGWDTKYGDSVTGYTPCTLLLWNEISVEKISKIGMLYGDNKWVKMRDRDGDKESCEILYPVYTWTEQGWTRIHRVIRHRLCEHKKVLRVITRSGLVDVTDDHSLIKRNGELISPKDVNNTHELLHYSLPRSTFFGIFYGNTATSLLHGHKHLSHMYNGVMLNSDQRRRSDYWFKIMEDYPLYIPVTGDTASKQHIIAQICLLAMSNGYYVYFEEVNGEYVLKYANCHTLSHPNTVLDVQEIPYEGYVYDLTTDNHHFQAGIGSIIVHNTDSIMVMRKDVTRHDIQHAFEQGKILEEHLNGLFERPIRFELEKIMVRGVFMKKKNYVCNMYTSPTRSVMLFKGLSVVRRDRVGVMKNTLTNFFHILCKECDEKRALTYIEEQLIKLYKGDVPVTELILSQGLQKEMSEYGPNEVHVAVARRAKKRDGNYDTEPGTRIKYMFVQGMAKQKVSELAEDPKYVIENDLPIDYDKYVESIFTAIKDILPHIYTAKQIRELRSRVMRYRFARKQRKLRARPDNKIMTHFLATHATYRFCALCYEETTNAEFCDACSDSEPALKRKKEREQERLLDIEENDRIWAVCNECQQGDKDMVNSCCSTDCNNYYLRLVSSRKVREWESEG